MIILAFLFLWILPFVFPFFYIENFSLNVLFENSEWLPVLMKTHSQAMMSTLVSLFVGLVLFCMSFYLTQKQTRYFLVIMLVPQFLPSLFIVSSFMSWFELMNVSISGFFGVVFFHSFVNAGLVCFLLSISFSEKIKAIFFGNRIYGLKDRSVLLKYGHKFFNKNMFFIFMSVYLLCFTSFSIPLLVGGSGFDTLETFIYKKILHYGRLDLAYFLSLIQWVQFLVLFSFVSKVKSEKIEFSFVKNIQFYPSSFWGRVFYVFTLGFLSLLVVPLLKVFNELKVNYQLVIDIISLTLKSLMPVAVFIVFNFLFFMGYSLLGSDSFVKGQKIRNQVATVLNSFNGLGVFFVVLPMFYFSLFVEQKIFSTLILGIVFGVVYSPILFRFTQSILDKKIEKWSLVSNIYKLSFMNRFVISYKELKTYFVPVIFVGSIWVLSDFGIASLFVSSNENLAVAAMSRLDRYQWQEAYLMMGFVSLLGVLGLLKIMELNEYSENRST